MAKSDNNKNITVRDVDAILSYGQVYSSKSWDIFFIAMFSSNAFLALCGIALWIFSGTDEEFLFYGIAVFIFGIVLLLIIGLLYIYIMHGRRKAKKYLKDAEVLNAKATASGSEWEVRVSPITAFFKKTSLVVKFRYNGKRYLKISCVGLPVYNKYTDKEITIAYSPKYDEVMLLKSEK